MNVKDFVGAGPVAAVLKRAPTLYPEPPVISALRAGKKLFACQAWSAAFSCRISMTKSINARTFAGGKCRDG